DWTSRNENSWILQNNLESRVLGPTYSDGIESGGWSDSNLFWGGNGFPPGPTPPGLQTKTILMQRHHSHGGLTTLYAPPWIKGKTGTRKSFYDSVIKDLVGLKKNPENNNIYGWLEVMFNFCRNKPFAYYSLYKPSPRILSIGQKFGVRVIHVPLKRIPQRMLQRHQSFKFMSVTRDHWEDLLDRIGEHKRPGWTAPPRVPVAA